MEHLTPEQKAEYQQAFSIYDKDGDGKITGSELGIVLRCLGQNPTQGEIGEMIQGLGTEESSCIDFEAFMKILNKRISDNSSSNDEEVIIQAFRVFDKEGAGTIGVAELRHMMMNLGEKLSDEEVDEMIREADVDAEGKVNYEEFIKTLLSK